MYEKLLGESEIFRDNIRLLAEHRLGPLLRALARKEHEMANTIADLDAELTQVIGDEATTEQTVGQVLADLKSKQGQPSPDFSAEVGKLAALDAALKNLGTTAMADDPAPDGTADTSGNTTTGASTTGANP